MDSGLVEGPQERRARFLLEFENPFKCEKCGERFKKKADARAQGRSPFILNMTKKAYQQLQNPIFTTRRNNRV